MTGERGGPDRSTGNSVLKDGDGVDLIHRDAGGPRVGTSSGVAVPLTPTPPVETYRPRSETPVRPEVVVGAHTTERDTGPVTVGDRGPTGVHLVVARTRQLVGVVIGGVTVHPWKNRSP